MGISEATVTLTVLRVHMKEVSEIYAGEFSENSVSFEHCTFIFHKMDYGELDHTRLLEAKGIAHDINWEAGDDHQGGTSCLRFNAQGEKDYVEHTDGLNKISVDFLLEHINEPDKLIEEIKRFASKRIPLSWDDQVANGQLYRMKQLLLTT